MDMDKVEKRNKIGSLPAREGSCCTEDNLAIALSTYFESQIDCPEGDRDDETGWSQWAMDKTDNLLDRIVTVLLPTRQEAAESIAKDIADHVARNNFAGKEGVVAGVFNRLRSLLRDGNQEKNFHPEVRRQLCIVRDDLERFLNDKRKE